jgi:hypothetical protein
MSWKIGLTSIVSRRKVRHCELDDTSCTLTG